MKPIWSTDSFERSFDYENRGDFKSFRCGTKYTLTGSAAAIIEGFKTSDRMLITEALRRYPSGPDPVIVDSQFIKRALSLRPPSIAERIERGIDEIVMLCPQIGIRYSVGDNHEETRRIRDGLQGATYSNSPEELLSYLKEYDRRGLIKLADHSPGVIAKFLVSLEAHSRWDLDLQNSQRAFVAMWFSETMNEVYEAAIEPAIRSCGYRAIRIDEKEHNNKIDDEIIAEIRRSKFLVADFTSERDRPRGGVYYEAGFAQGIGIPVVWTCKEDLIDQVHFDTRQFNHIVWTEPADLRTKLANRIRATIGQGPLDVETR